MSEQVRAARDVDGLRSTLNTLSEHRQTHPPVARWESRYRYAVITADVLTVVLVVIAVGAVMSMRHTAFGPLSLALLDILTVVVVVGSLAINRVWTPAVLGQGAEEFRRLGRGLFGAVVALGLGALAVDIPGARLWIFVVVPAIALVAFPMRYLLRRPLHRGRGEGRFLLSVLAAGNLDTVEDLIHRTKRVAHLGWRVDAICTIDGRGRSGTDVDGVPVVGQLRELAEHVRRGGYRIVAITPDAYWTPRRLQQLAWALEGSGADMVVSPGLMEVAGPRLHMSAVLGMPLLRVSEPALSGFRRLVKEVVDRVGALVLLVALAPLMFTVAAFVMIDSRGPVFYRQKRVGKTGVPFTIIKFRTMVTNADALRARLASVDEGNGVLFKMKKDPRITKVGTFLRRYSIDELPQLFNVLAGSMSLVGPRPPLPEETAKYSSDVRRRLLVKPGLTGLWQVSGRSDLSWEESIRLDLRYVEDWSLALDLVIMWKTFRAVFGGQGAY
ncbi:exopolysaccharide biosynthesis polyprenyl glycosylphosphotransferase [Lentzea albidocapillata subsp. violacea]|uniref:Exopolysaccharide biosynthesis polyprenyl glycosylphosphotransferase n=1 Tax=Lentzea albidocapillata subsp. violacea TaxID=128104 RepID=A0A1G9RAR1_9PSEU|nr:sugar transferase [Lentzea albidocapillata]SDM20412.1 exopolysaccharide biosynthesis polyprenyl glycosylphosphotransferase [Lentzea albidocapillata subsp. violacea]